MTLALTGAVIVWLVASPTAALLLGRVMRARNLQVPSAPPVGADAAAHRRAQLRVVR